jgi:hypothetical protein
MDKEKTKIILIIPIYPVVIDLFSFLKLQPIVKR